ncbi:DUF2523 family protein [Acinetobacter gerneri]|uniref:DUF2523 family protein n=1 Tax=Acinetobacter gerneri TaxID=202952 RepID=UPI0028A9B741|nr:DUF2523 family protein [Acinetobacter gerneri]
MYKLLSQLLEWLLKGSVKRALTGAGLGLASSASILIAVKAYINNFIAQSNSMGADVLALLSLSGVDIALSAIIGAIVFRLTVNSAKLSLVRVKS